MDADATSRAPPLVYNPTADDYALRESQFEAVSPDSLHNFEGILPLDTWISFSAVVDISGFGSPQGAVPRRKVRQVKTAAIVGHRAPDGVRRTGQSDFHEPMGCRPR
jgi:hypothetical protein